MGSIECFFSIEYINWRIPYNLITKSVEWLSEVESWIESISEWFLESYAPYGCVTTGCGRCRCRIPGAMQRLQLIFINNNRGIILWVISICGQLKSWLIKGAVMIAPNEKSSSTEFTGANCYVNALKLKNPNKFDE